MPAVFKVVDHSSTHPYLVKFADCIDVTVYLQQSSPILSSRNNFAAVSPRIAVWSAASNPALCTTSHGVWSPIGNG